MTIVIDTIRSPSITAMRAAGVSGVCRYLSWLDRDSLGKIIHQPEFDTLIGNGFGVLLNWEFDAQDWLGGATAGRTHATEAVKQARALGYPTGCAIAGSADFNMTLTQWSGVGKAYITAYAAVMRIAGYRPGVYGPWDVLTWCRDAGQAEVFWQAGMSTSWSGGRNANLWPGAHLRQRRQAFIGGVDCDINDIIQANYGQHGGAMDETERVARNADSSSYALVSDADTVTLIFRNPVDQTTTTGTFPNVAKAKRLALEAKVAALSLGGVDLAALTTQVVAGVIAAHDTLTDADKPVLEAAIRDVLHGA